MEKEISKEKKQSRVSWSISATFDCPHCDHSMDFMNMDEYWFYSRVGENKEVFESPIEWECPECEKEFIINGSDY